MGNGSLGALAKYADIYSIDAVIVSHLHVDHFIDLCSYYVALKYKPDGPTRPLAVWGPSDTGRRLVTAYGLKGTETVSSEFEIRDLEPEFSVGPFTIKTTRVVHPVEAYGLRVEAGGATLAYSGDTGPTDRLLEVGRDADLALFEASFLDSEKNPKDLHMSSREAADHAARAGAQRLLLTHLVPWNDPAETLEQAKGHFPGEISLAHPGLRITL
jgi:ribonuclease BN (tRNA processing enzyme)